MSSSKNTLLWPIVGSVLLLAVVAGVTFGLMALKRSQVEAAAAAAQSQPEFSAAVESAVVRLLPYTKTSTAIGTVRALRSITLRNELPGTVAKVSLETGQVVDEGAPLVELDVAVEEAQLAALQAEARLAGTMLGRMERALEQQGASAADVDRARAERDMALANVARLEAVIAQKRLRAPFRAVVGLVDLHLGQYLEPGTQITTLQGIDDAVHVDFAVTQEVGALLQPGTLIEVATGPGLPPMQAQIVAKDARVDIATRNTWIRAALHGEHLPQPGASVRVKVPVAAERQVMVVPVSALRRGPDGSTVWVLQDAGGQTRAQPRRVQSGAVLGDEVIVESGLEVGERVAAEGSFKIKYPGMLITLPREQAAQAPAAGVEHAADTEHKGN